MLGPLALPGAGADRDTTPPVERNIVWERPSALGTPAIPGADLLASVCKGGRGIWEPSPTLLMLLYVAAAPAMPPNDTDRCCCCCRCPNMLGPAEKRLVLKPGAEKEPAALLRM